MKSQLKGLYLPILCYLYFYLMPLYAKYLPYFFMSNYYFISQLLCGLCFIFMLFKKAHFSLLSFLLILAFPFIIIYFPYIPALLPSEMAVFQLDFK